MRHSPILLLVDPEDCSVTVVIDTDSKNVDPSKYAGMKPLRCPIHSIFVVSHVMTYETSDLFKDQIVKQPYLLRTNYDDGRYTAFLLPLLYNSTYTLILRDEYFTSTFPGGEWIDNAIAKMDPSHPAVVTCSYLRSLQYDVFTSNVEGSLFLESIKLRYILTMTDFQRPDLSPFFFFSQAMKCKFGAVVIPQTCVSFNHPPERLHFLRKLFSHPVPSMKRLNENCVATLGIADVHCVSRRLQDNSTGYILSQYRREYLDMQIEAIKQSSVPPADIIVYQNGIFKDYKNLLRKYRIKAHVWAINWQSPYFLRNLLPLLFRTSFHVIMDDDIIPGHETVRDLISEIQMTNVPTGVGGRWIDFSNYRTSSFSFVCVDCKPKISTHKVDFVIQVYARNVIQTKVFWRYEAYTQRNGEDLHGSLSFTMECGRYARRPPMNRTSSYQNFGHDSVATYLKPVHNVLRPKIFRSCVIAGYKPLFGREILQEYPEMRRKWKRENLHMMRYFSLFCWNKHFNTTDSE